MNNQKKIGAIFLYIVTILNTVISLFLTPFILYKLGDVDVYKRQQVQKGNQIKMNKARIALKLFFTNIYEKFPGLISDSVHAR